ncbi:hypothetical protein CDAR_377121 [Caerostris darwini]|uniref:Transmembrane protein n=1 Tax=Caerostris darwini TaxID=1538125 RepID=A0AAV4US19_9ARAC|nr:hypothetical protein CDAR_377121 [Caerostris darwini]
MHKCSAASVEIKLLVFMSISIVLFIVLLIDCLIEIRRRRRLLTTSHATLHFKATVQEPFLQDSPFPKHNVVTLQQDRDLHVEVMIFLGPAEALVWKHIKQSTITGTKPSLFPQLVSQKNMHKCSAASVKIKLLEFMSTSIVLFIVLLIDIQIEIRRRRRLNWLLATSHATLHIKATVRERSLQNSSFPKHNVTLQQDRELHLQVMTFLDPAGDVFRWK